LSLGDLRRVHARRCVLLDPVGGASRGLVRPVLVLADRDGHAATVGANGRVADEAGHTADDLLHFVAPLGNDVEQFRGAVTGVAPNYDIHVASFPRLSRTGSVEATLTDGRPCGISGTAG